MQSNEMKGLEMNTIKSQMTYQVETANPELHYKLGDEPQPGIYTLTKKLNEREMHNA